MKDAERESETDHVIICHFAVYGKKSGSDGLVGVRFYAKIKFAVFLLTIDNELLQGYFYVRFEIAIFVYGKLKWKFFVKVACKQNVVDTLQRFWLIY